MTENIESLKVINRKEVPGYFTAFLLENDIIEVAWDRDLKEVDKVHLVELQKAFGELGNGKKMRVYISTNDFMNITSKGRQFASSENAQHYTLANAVLVDHLGKRLLFNFFMSVSNMRTPTRGFNTREEAIVWLLNIT